MLWLPVWFNLFFTVCKSLILQLAKAPHTITEPPPCFTWLAWYRRLRLFHQLFAAQRPSYLTQRFRTLIHHSKRLNSIALLSSLYCGAFWHCFATSTMVSSLQFCHIGQLHSVFFSWWMLTKHEIGSIVQWCLELSAFFDVNWWQWWNCPLFLLLLLVYQPNFWSCFVPFPDVS